MTNRFLNKIEMIGAPAAARMTRAADAGVENSDFSAPAVLSGNSKRINIHHHAVI